MKYINKSFFKALFIAAIAVMPFITAGQGTALDNHNTLIAERGAGGVGHGGGGTWGGRSRGGFDNRDFDRGSYDRGFDRGYNRGYDRGDVNVYGGWGGVGAGVYLNGTGGQYYNTYPDSYYSPYNNYYGE